MAINITWDFPQADRKKNQNGFQDVIEKVNFIITAEDTDTGEFETVYDSIILDPPQVGQPFIPYQALTHAKVLGWVKAKLDDNHIKGKGNEQKNAANYEKIARSKLERKQARESNNIRAPLPF